MKLMEKKKIIVLYPCTDDKSYDDGFYFGAKHVMDMINNAPTIDAIPVEWLEAHKTRYFEDWGKEPVTVENALKMWQREQEGR